MSLVCLVSFKETPDKYNKTKIIVLKGEGLIFTNFLSMAGYVAFVSSRPWRFLSIELLYHHCTYISNIAQNLKDHISLYV